MSTGQTDPSVEEAADWSRDLLVGCCESLMEPKLGLGYGSRKEARNEEQLGGQLNAT